MLTTTKYERDNIDEVIHVLQNFYEEEKRRQGEKFKERDER